jgi:translation initiation factor 2B subunit (eIF-2B alpha/beta/delta family)
MEEFMNIMELKVKSLELSPDKVNSISEKDCYIGAFLLGFIEYLQNIKIDSLVQFTEKLEKEIFNKKLVEELTKAQIIPKNSVAISLEAVIDELQYIIKKYTSQKDLPKELSTILNELILKAQKLFIFYSSGKKEIAKNFNKSIHKDSKIFVYGYSNDVIFSLIYARKQGKIFTVYLSSDEVNDSNKICEVLIKNDIDCKLVSGISIMLYLKNVDFILTGADAICENAGIINQVGTHALSICAKQYSKPIYVLASSLKFLKMYIIEEKDLTYFNKTYSSSDNGIVDFTPAEFITTFFTDKGIFLPYAICDEIIKLFYTLK